MHGEAIQTSSVPQPVAASPLALVTRFRRDEPALFWTGVAHLALLPVLFALMPLDERTVLGIDPWVKPAKFAASIGIYTLTIGLLLLPLSESRAKRFIRGGTVLAMSGEMVIILAQAARGTLSHFNETSTLDRMLFISMGVLILLATAAGVALLVQYTRPLPLAKPLLWGVRLGLLVMLVGSAVGGHMIANRAHTVGAPDGGEGLPFVNWSLEHGDLRTAHFLGLHALQAIPLAGLIAARRYPEGQATRVVMVFAVLYVWAVALLYAQALMGLPLVGA